jgi:hypothetical protein
MQKISGLKDADLYGGYLFVKPKADNGYLLGNTHLDSNLNRIKNDTFYTSEGPTFFGFWVPNGNKSIYGITIGSTEIYGKLFVAKTDQDGRVNIKEPKPTLPLKIFPNPAKELLNIEISEEGKTYTVEIIDMLSKTILTQQITCTSTLNIENLTNGFYSVKLIDNTGKVSVNKLLIVK